jgi:hypothetical protein
MRGLTPGGFYWLQVTRHRDEDSNFWIVHQFFVGQWARDSLAGAVQGARAPAAPGGFFRARRSILRRAQVSDLFQFWVRRGRRDAYWAALVNEYLAQGGGASGVRAGTAYVDVGTLNGYREAVRLLSEPGHERVPAERRQL